MRITSGNLEIRKQSVSNSHAARDRKAAANRIKKCRWNGHTFVAKNSRAVWCDEHRPERSRSSSPKATRFVALDGEGITYSCLEWPCKCSQYHHECTWSLEYCIKNGLHDICVCGHRKYVNNFKESGGHAHTYPLLGMGKSQLIHEDGSDLQWYEIYDFIYRDFLKLPRQTAVVGFSLGYDFTMWHKSLDWSRAAAMYDRNDDHYKKRLKTSPDRRVGNNDPFPVVITPPEEWECPVPILDGGYEWRWQADMLGNNKRFKLRPQPCACENTNCDHVKSIACPVPWMYVCDVFPFFQKSFMAVIKDIDGISDERRQRLAEGKSNRDVAILDEEMKLYNIEENETLANDVMPLLDKGFREIGVILSRKQWFGPGQASGKWLGGTKDKKRAPEKRHLEPNLPDGLMLSMQAGFQAGWWDIFAHGHIPGESYIYDINSSYPKDISTLPCLGEHYKKDGEWNFSHHGKWHLREIDSSKPLDVSNIELDTLVFGYGIVQGFDPYIGAMLHRDKQGYISRPHLTRGWFWIDEVQAAIEAGLIENTYFTRLWIHEPTCDCPSPLFDITDLYEKRLSYGKNTSLGMSSRLTMNSAYGKTVQSVGNSPYQNWIWGSRITSGTRTKILNAIATHPYGTKDVLMVSTDAFASKHRHPGLPISKVLGEWSENKLSNLSLGKPGWWWTDDAREALKQGIALKSKQRGFSADAFKEAMPKFDEMFTGWRGPNEDGTGWPKLPIHLGFAMMTAKQALHQNNWELAGKVISRTIEIDTASNMKVKRDPGWFDEDYGIYRSVPKMPKEYTASYGYNPKNGPSYLREMGIQDPEALGITPDGTWEMLRAEAMG